MIIQMNKIKANGYCVKTGKIILGSVVEMM